MTNVDGLEFRPLTLADPSRRFLRRVARVGLGLPNRKRKGEGVGRWFKGPAPAKRDNSGSSVKAYLALFSVITLWSSSYVATKHILDFYTPIFHHLAAFGHSRGRVSDFLSRLAEN